MTALPIILNPVARGGRTPVPRESLEQAAAAAGYRVEWWSTSGPGHATELAARAARDRAPVVAVWGGDGTYNECAAGLIDSETAMVLLPGGTTSVLVYELGIPRRPEQALTAQLGGEPRQMAVGRTDRGQLFLLMLSAGPDSVIVANTPPALKQRVGKAGYGVQAVLEFSRAHLPSFAVAINGETRRAAWCIVGNCRCYGGPFAATPGADPFNSGLETVLLTREGRFAAVPFFFAIPFGRHLTMKGVETHHGDEVTLSADEPVPYQLDGDIAGELPVTARASAERLRVLLPRGLSAS